MKTQACEMQNVRPQLDLGGFLAITRNFCHIVMRNSKSVFTLLASSIQLVGYSFAAASICSKLLLFDKGPHVKCL